METKPNSEINRPQTAIGPVHALLERKLTEHFDLLHLQVVNESANHNVPSGSESHFKLVLVADDFAGLSPVARHRSVHSLLASELAGPIHALSIHAYTAQQWQQRFGDAPLSPPCLGGGARDRAADE